MVTCFLFHHFPSFVPLKELNELTVLTRDQRTQNVIFSHQLFICRECGTCMCSVSHSSHNLNLLTVRCRTSITSRRVRLRKRSQTMYCSNNNKPWISAASLHSSSNWVNLIRSAFMKCRAQQAAAAVLVLIVAVME